MPDIFLGRQAIYDSDLRVHAYALLYRGDQSAGTAKFVNGDLASARVISNAFLEMGAQRLVGDDKCFINLTGSYLTGELPLPLPANRVVAEILKDVIATPDIIRSVIRLKAKGVLIALDDYIHRPENELLVQLADYIKIDILAQSAKETARLCDMLRKYDVKLLAEKVETMAQMKFCRSLGFEYYQGFFLTRPEVIEGRSLPSSRVGLLKVLERLLDPNLEMEELNQLISQDASLSFKLLRYANSAMYAPEQPISAMGEMIMRLGMKTVRGVVSLLILLEFNDHPGDLLAHTLVRARMCESIATLSGETPEVTFYTTGLFSTLDALTGTSMAELLKQVPLAEDIERALLTREGRHGEVLRCAKAFEKGNWSRSTYKGLGSKQLSEAYAASVAYSREVWRSVAHMSRAA